MTYLDLPSFQTWGLSISTAADALSPTVKGIRLEYALFHHIHVPRCIT